MSTSSEGAPLLPHPAQRPLALCRKEEYYLFSAGQVFVFIAVISVLIWFLHYDTGLDWNNADCAGKPCVFNYHPPMMVLGFLAFGYQGIMSWRMLPDGLSHQTKKFIHLSVQVSGFVLAVVGIVAVFKFHNQHQPPIANLYSLHSWLGLVAMILWGLQVVGAVVSFISGVVPVENRVSFVPIHKHMGVVLYLLALVVMLLGIQEKLGFYQGDKAYAKLTPISQLGNIMGLSIVAIFSVCTTLMIPRMQQEAATDS
ncbi:hypothetical protein SARC_02364 [Sphaeroforma arctica JP610]|uniref:Cytochrome b561 domain-containing protein n=1 Tax=Sphaeroforma arctica JP610 TaxID=667725 RepID=A0A0L0G968_9EUKA|nr:hypothetical protein SARC_02364 [Sphaeroforma arctica JP610]KNC85459.1 hypothetical protein SARC_02364 [Sphaeroforma arctica JP610]|eukprot:XP_014159361.1 hypothetical protein SARC_02364 [Sphaeroforma arctica JP610]